MTTRWLDALALTASLAALAIVFLYLSPVPAEDACILFRYSENLATGSGIVWNVGDDPVEGATEFSWMLLIAAIIRAGLPVLPTSQAAGMTFSAATCVLLYVGSRRWMKASWWAAFVASFSFGASTAALHAGTAFATPLFTLLVVAAVQLTARMLNGTDGERRAGLALPLVLLLACLTRPEGVLLGALLYIAIASGKPAQLTRRFVVQQLLFLALPGILYFLWRWNYFGHLLPNTFYIKAAVAGLNPASARKIFKFIAVFCCGPLLAAGAASLLGPSRDRIRSLLLPLAALLYMTAYLRFEMIQDIGFRFLFPGLAALLALLPASLDKIAGERRPRWRVAAAFALATLTILSSPRMVRASDYEAVHDDRFDIGRALARHDPASHSMIATEAGYLPFLSHWVAVDPFGLNDERIAHEGLTEAYVASRAPDLVMFHVDTPDYAERWTPTGADRWETMTKLLYRYAEKSGYERVAVIRKGCDPKDGYHWYYLKPGVADGAAIAAAIREADRSATRRCTDQAL